MRRVLFVLSTCLAACVACTNRQDISAPDRSTVATPVSPLSPVTTPSPIPTQTPWPTATWAPWPTFTPSPRPAFPREAVPPEGYPPLPANLFFIRNNSLWLWPQEGGALEQVVAGPEISGRKQEGDCFGLASGPPPAGVTTYRVTPDGRYIVFAFSNPDAGYPYAKLMVLDRTTGISTTISTPGFSPYIDITPDGRYVFYATGATIFGAEVQDPGHQFELGQCGGRSEGTSATCHEFTVAPDGSQIAFTDGLGIWTARVPQGSPRLLVKHEYPETGSSFCGVFRIRNWSPDNRQLLVDVGCYEGGSTALLNTETGEIQEVPDTFTYVEAWSEVGWSPDSQQLAVANANLSGSHLFLVSAQDTDKVSSVFKEAPPPLLSPAAPHFLRDGRIGFAVWRCIDDQKPSPGIFAIDSDGTDLEEIAPLPAVSCHSYNELLETPHSEIMWTADGAGFLLNPYSPQLLGLTDGSALWDVRGVLLGARSLQWQKSP
jgi:hypothetical protein